MTRYGQFQPPNVPKQPPRMNAAKRAKNMEKLEEAINIVTENCPSSEIASPFYYVDQLDAAVKKLNLALFHLHNSEKNQKEAIKKITENIFLLCDKQGIDFSEILLSIVNDYKTKYNDFKGGKLKS